MSDIYPVPGQPFVHAYPIVNRYLTPGLWMSWSIGEGKVWPVENDANVGDEFGQRQIWCYYAEDHPDIPGPFEEHVGPGVYYDEKWDTIQLFSELDTRFDPGQYLYAPTWLHYDIPSDVAGRIERAEFICSIGTSDDQFPDDLRLLVQMRSGITDYEGWRPSPWDFRTMQGASVCPPLLSSEIHANGMSFEGHRYSDPYIDRNEWGNYPTRHVLPINEAGLAQIRRGGRVGIMAGLDGSTAPADRNFLWMECQYTDWDEYLPTQGPHRAGFLLPTLRLWLGGGEAEMTLGLRIEARPSIDDPKSILSHAARRRRGW